MSYRTAIKMILVVGSSGAVGQLLVPYWQRENVPVVLQHRRTGVRDAALPSLDWDPDQRTAALERWVADHGSPEAMIILAGVTPRSGSALNLNTKIAETCLEAARAVGISRVLLASSSAVYGMGADRGYTEADTPTPINAYGVAKLAMEQACMPWREAGLEICCLRIGNVAGADALLLNTMNKRADDPVDIDSFGDGRGPLRSYIGPATLANVLAALARHTEPLPPILNIAAPDPVYMEDLAHAAVHSYTLRPSTAAAHQHITLNCARLAKLYNFAASASDASQMVAQWKETLLQ